MTTINEEDKTNENSTENSSTQEIELLQQQLQQANEKYLRALAEVENTKKRSEQSIIAANKFALSDFAKDLLPIIDLFNKAINSVEIEKLDNNIKAVLTGIKMTQVELEKIFSKFGIIKINSLNVVANANLHEIIGFVENKDLEDGIIFQVIEDGYTLHERLLRAAKVVVIKNN